MRDIGSSPVLGTIADLELRIHKQLLERLDLLNDDAGRGHSTERIMLLENNVEDVCRELHARHSSARILALGTTRQQRPGRAGRRGHRTG